MSELEPGFNTAVKDERDVLKQKQDEYERALFDVQQKEAFGKFDVAVPNSGEDTYQSYLDQRPSESIVLNSADKPVGAETNRFASKEAYEAQNSSTQDYYDKLGGVAAKQEQFTPPTYEEMGLLQLAKEASKARQLGDPAEEATIRAALENHLAGDALKDDTETPEQAQARYDADLARYDDLVDRLSKRGETWPPHAAETHAEPNGEGQPSARTEATTTEAEASTEEANTSEAAAEASDTADEAEEAPAETEQTTDTAESNTDVAPIEAEATEVAPVVEAEETEATKPKTALPIGGSYNGKSITATGFIPDPSGDSSKDMVPVVDEDGNVLTILASDIVYTKAAVAGKEVELYQADKKQLLPVEAEVEAEEEKKGIKKWFGKIKDGLYRAAGSSFWAGEWARNGYSKWIDHNIDDSMDEAEKQEKRDRNRNAAVVAGIAVGAIVLGGAAFAIGSNLIDSFGAKPTAGGAQGAGMGDFAGQWDPSQHAADANEAASHGPTNLPIEGTPGVETVTDAAPAAGGEIFVRDGEGGRDLLERLQISPDKWDTISQQLISLPTNEFYLEGGDVRIMDDGQLSQAAQDIINSAR